MRTHQRLEFKDIVRYEPLSVDPAGEHLNRKADGRNLSLTGIYFETKADAEILTHLKVGNIVWVAFRIPEYDEEIKVQCEIRRVLDLGKNKTGFGSMFINLSSRAERAIAKFLK